MRTHVPALDSPSGESLAKRGKDDDHRCRHEESASHLLRRVEEPVPVRPIASSWNLTLSNTASFSTEPAQLHNLLDTISLRLYRPTTERPSNLLCSFLFSSPQILKAPVRAVPEGFPKRKHMGYCVLSLGFVMRGCLPAVWAWRYLDRSF